MLKRKKTKASLVAGGLLIAAACTATAAYAVSGSSSVAKWVAGSTKLSAVPGDKTVTIAVHLALKNLSGLKTLVAQVSSPSSKEYGHYLTIEELSQRFAPASADVASVKSLLEGAGMSNVVVGPLGAYVSATSTVAQIRNTFHVSQDYYSYHGLTLRANREDPTLPATLNGKVAYVEGLDDTTSLRHPYHRSVTQGELVAPLKTAASVASDASSSTATAVTPPPVAAGNPSPYCNTHFGPGRIEAHLSTPADVYGGSIPWLNCGYTPEQIQTAYGLNKTKYDGAGVKVAIIDAYASPTLMADGNRYAANHGLPKLTAANFTQIIPSGIYNVDPTDACGPQGWWVEESLDIAAVHGSAPGAHIVYIGASDCNTSLDIALFNTVYNHLADVVTNSYGFNGEAIAPGEQATYDQAFMAGAALGITVLFSSGDDGDLSAINGVASGSWPATSSYVTGVGGTTLFLWENGIKSEFGWGTYRAFLADVTVKSQYNVATSGVETTTAFGYTFDDYAFYAGSGGGISLLEAQPAYQAGIVPVALATSLNLASGYVETLPTAQRVSPDIAMDADPYTGYLYGESYTIAGDPILDSGCKPISKTEEYCENAEGGTSLASPLMAGVIAIMNQKRVASGEPTVGFANPLLYSLGSGSNGVALTNAAINQIVAPKEPVSVLRGYKANLNEARVVTVNSVPFNLATAPYGLEVCGLDVCEGINDVWNYTSLSPAALPPTPAGYNDVTGLGVPYLPKLINAE